MTSKSMYEIVISIKKIQEGVLADTAVAVQAGVKTPFNRQPLFVPRRQDSCVGG